MCLRWPLAVVLLTSCSTTMRLPNVDENLARKEAHRHRIAAVKRRIGYENRLAYGVTDQLSVVGLTENSPADISGIIPGDKIKGVCGRSIG